MTYTIEYFSEDSLKKEQILDDNHDKMLHNIYNLLKFRNIKFIKHISKFFT